MYGQARGSNLGHNTSLSINYNDTLTGEEKEEERQVRRPNWPHRDQWVSLELINTYMKNKGKLSI